MIRKHSAIFTTLLMIFILVLSSTIIAETELEKKVFHLEGNLTGRLNVKLDRFDIYTNPKGFHKDFLFVPKLGDFIFDANEGLVYEPEELTKTKSTDFYREEMKHTKWTKKEEGPLGHQYFLSYGKDDKFFGVSISSLNQKTRLSLTLKNKK